MSITSRTLWTTLAAALVASAALAGAAAQTSPQPGQPGRGQREAEARRGAGPFAPMLWQLDLTEAQRQQIRTILEEQRQSDHAPLAKAADLRRQMHAAIFADSPDLAKIDQLKSEIAQADAAALAARVAVELKIAEVLTAEQRAQARELRAGREGRGHGRLRRK